MVLPEEFYIGDVAAVEVNVEVKGGFVGGGHAVEVNFEEEDLVEEMGWVWAGRAEAAPQVCLEERAVKASIGGWRRSHQRLRDLLTAQSVVTDVPLVVTQEQPVEAPQGAGPGS